MVEPAVTKLPIKILVTYFIFYVVIHIVIGIARKNTELETLKNPNDEDAKRIYKIMDFSFKWFPALYVIFIIVMLYL